MIEKTGNEPNVLESLVKTEGVTGVTGVTGSLEESFMRARVRAHGRVRVSGVLVGNTGNTGNSSPETPCSKRDPSVTGAPWTTGNTGNAPALYTDRPSLNSALRLPVAQLHTLPARLTYRLSHALGQVAWTTHPGVYEALRGSWAAFSPLEFLAAVMGGESGVATARDFGAWVATKLATPGWRLTSDEALRWGPRARMSGFGWWPGADWCDAHDIEPRRGWTVGYACAAFGCTPVSVELHAEEEVVHAA